MKNQRNYYLVFLWFLYAASGCINNSTPVASLTQLPQFKIYVRDHETQEKLRYVDVTLAPAGSNTAPILKKTNSLGEVSFDYSNINDGAKISFFIANKEPVTITIERKAGLAELGVEMWNLSTGNNSINGILKSVTSSEQPETEYTVRSQFPPYESDNTEMGVYALSIANQSGPFQMVYMTSADSIKLKV
ncbi:MAG TPA: hypothetical protein DCF33_08475, partial [Saprospirales bacterium]|nr:hypothetical protein [Saprospirales bacterium]